MRSSYLIFSIPQHEGRLDLSSGISISNHSGQISVVTGGGGGNSNLTYIGIGGGGGGGNVFSLSSGAATPIVNNTWVKPVEPVEKNLKERGIGILRLGTLNKVLILEPVVLRSDGVILEDSLYDPNSGDVFFKGELRYDIQSWDIPFLINDDSFRVLPNCSFAANGVSGVIKEIVLCEDDLFDVRMMLKARKAQIS